MPKQSNRIAVAALVFAVSLPLHAEWRVTPSIAAGIQTDDNATMSPVSDFETSLEGYALELDSNFQYRGQLTTLSIIPRLRFERYDDESAFDTNDEFLRINLDRDGQRSKIRFRGIISNESIREGEDGNVDFDIEDPIDIPTDSTGTSFSTSDRLRTKLTPQWSYRIGERSNIGLNLTYLKVDYKDDSLSELRDFDEIKYTGQYSYDLTLRDAVGLQAYYRSNDFDAAGRDISGSGAGVTYERTVSEKTRLQFLVGVDSTESEDGEDQSNPVGQLSLTHRLETGRILASYRRTVNGTGNGVVSQRDQIDISGSRDLSERTSFGLGVRFYSLEAIDGNVANFDEQDYLQFRAQIAWRLKRYLTLELNYRHTRLDRLSFVTEADSNRFGLWLRYAPEL